MYSVVWCPVFQFGIFQTVSLSICGHFTGWIKERHSGSSQLVVRLLLGFLKNTYNITACGRKYRSWWIGCCFFLCFLLYSTFRCGLVTYPSWATAAQTTYKRVQIPLFPCIWDMNTLALSSHSSNFWLVVSSVGQNPKVCILHFP